MRKLGDACDLSAYADQSEVRALFPGRTLLLERVILAKSYMVQWMAEDLAPAAAEVPVAIPEAAPVPARRSA